MSNEVRRVLVEKQPGFDIEAQHMCHDLVTNLGITGLRRVRIINRYDVSGLEAEEYEQARNTVFSEPNVDFVYDESVNLEPEARVFAVEALPGQYDQRADSAAQCIQILTQKERPEILTARLIVLYGDVSEAEFEAVRSYCINPVDSREASLDKPVSLRVSTEVPPDVRVLLGFTALCGDDELLEYKESLGIVMNLADFRFCQRYFREQERRDPTITEMKAIDTYWSDHCRHTTFLAAIDEVVIESSGHGRPIQEAYERYLADRDFVYGEDRRDICLMDIAVMGMKRLRREGRLQDLDVSDEINACSIVVTADIDGRDEEWLVMFKNETHNHPTEIEPFGGAATCLGGAIRDPLSGRVYVYQAMRVSGSGDPRASIADTLPGKLPQRKITTAAAAGYSSYGNQIGLATGQVAEVYDEGFVAKRMEIGAVIGAAPRSNVRREKPSPGDVIILLGGRTGRDGCGGATGSSVEHTEESIEKSGAEVQKGNPPTERKIQRLFRNPEASRLIKKCNDFGAGGVSVAIGELAEGVSVNLDAVPRKYEGLDGTELAISESQERMAVVLDPADVARFAALADEENLEAVTVATVTADRRLRMTWRGKIIMDISRDFLDTSGVKQRARVMVRKPLAEQNFFATGYEKSPADLQDAWLNNLRDLNVCGQRGLVERFDSTVGAGTVLMPFGGIRQATPAIGMAAKLPVLQGDTSTGTLMSYGYNPRLALWSPFHGGLYAVIEAVTKIVAMGGDYSSTHLTLQEYFEKLGDDPSRWGKPFSALLGAHFAQMNLGIAAIGGKDSMSGTFKDLDVPPTLVAFAVNTVDVRKVISPEFKCHDSAVVWLRVPRDSEEMPDFAKLRRTFGCVTELIGERKVMAAHHVGMGGVAAALSKMCFGNRIGFRASEAFAEDASPLFAPDLGALVLEIAGGEDPGKLFDGLEFHLLGSTQAAAQIEIGTTAINLDDAQKSWEMPLEGVFPTRVPGHRDRHVPTISYPRRSQGRPRTPTARPRVLIPVFPGTNCEYDTERSFALAGARTEVFVFRNLTAQAIEESLARMADLIRGSQIIALPGGFSAGDEPDGSGKFIAAVFRNRRIEQAVSELLGARDGLMLGICNGFQALIKLGLITEGRIDDIKPDQPTLTFNQIGRHISCMARTRITSVLSPWFAGVELGDVHTVALSHGEGRFMGDEKAMELLMTRGQVAAQYVDLSGEATVDIRFNPNGSHFAVEALTSPDGRVLGKMGHSERIGTNVGRNVPGDKDQRIFSAGVRYFTD